MSTAAACANADALIAKGICPVKPLHVRPWQPEHNDASEGQHARKAQSADAIKTERKSRKRERKDRAQTDETQLCFHFLRGACRMGDKCTFTHSLEAYLAVRPPDLPGSCPFQSLPQCPYGIRCRWASKHEAPDELTQKHIIDAAPQTRAVSNTDDATTTKNAEIIGTEVLQLPKADNIQWPVNELGAASRTQLRKKTYNFERADSCLKSLGFSINQPMRYKARRPPQATAEASVEAHHGDAAAKTTATQNAVALESNASLQAPQAVEASEATPTDPFRTSGNAETSSALDKDADAVAIRMASNDPDTKEALGLAGRVLAEEQPRVGNVPLYDGSRSQQDSATVRRDADCKRIDFRGKLYCAPLTTNGNLPFRRVVKNFGCDVTCGEMALCTNLLQGQASEWALLKRHPSEDCFGVQICGSHPDTVARCVQLLDDTIETDFIDINMGCPIDLVCEKGAGSALLQRPKRIESIVRAAAAVATRCGITFKTRTAYHKKQIAHTFLPQAGSWGAHAVTLHGRTREQRYSRTADWEYIGQVAAEMPDDVQLIGNGDIFSFEDYDRHMRDGKLATCMIARGALVKPWIFQEIKERRHWDISAGERLDMLKDFVRFGLEHWGSDEKGVETTRRFLLEWLSFMHRYVPVGLLERVPQQMTWRPPAYVGRSDLETLLSSSAAADWVHITEMLLGPTPASFVFTPKHKSNAYGASEADMAHVMSELQAAGTVVAAL